MQAGKEQHYETQTIGIDLRLRPGLGGGYRRRGGVLAQQRGSAHIHAQAADDDKIAVRVSDLPITQGTVRKATESRRLHDPTLSKDEADKASIVPLVGRKALIAEAKRRGVEPTGAEVKAYINRHRKDCDVAGAVCRDAITSMGFEYNEFWTIAAPDYEEALTATLVHQDNYQKSGLTDNSTEEEIWKARQAMGARALRAATLVWEDKRLQRLYEQALAEWRNKTLTK